MAESAQCWCNPFIYKYWKFSDHQTSSYSPIHQSLITYNCSEWRIINLCTNLWFFIHVRNFTH